MKRTSRKSKRNSRRPKRTSRRPLQRNGGAAQARQVRRLFMEKALHPSSSSYVAPRIPVKLHAVLRQMITRGEIYYGSDGLMRLSDSSRKQSRLDKALNAAKRAAAAAYASTKRVDGKLRGDERLVDRMNAALAKAKSAGGSAEEVAAAHDAGRKIGLSKIRVNTRRRTNRRTR